MSNNREYRKQAEAIFRQAIEAVEPEQLIKQHVRIMGKQLYIADEVIQLDDVQDIYVVGAGKATASMALALENTLQELITDGLILVKYGHALSLQKIRTVEAAHPVPDQNGIDGTRELIKLVQKANAQDLVIVLLSGGGSALLVDVPPPCSLPQLQDFFGSLLKSGADIGEINTIRKHLSSVKGGQLAKAIFPARCLTLILSDVIGDPLDVITSGPTVPDSSTFADAMRIIEKYQLQTYTPNAILQLLEYGLLGLIPETPKAGDIIFSKTTNCIIGSNSIALQAAQAKSHTLGFHTQILANNTQGEARMVARELVKRAKEVASDPNIPKPACLLMGGETTVTVKGDGLGGRNQELALAAALTLKDTTNITILSGGTDGSDGPTDAAGAVVDEYTIQEAQALGIDPYNYLHNHDSYTFFQQVTGHIKTGPTRTNVMDIIIALIY